MTEFQKSYELTISDPSAIAMAEAAKARIQAAYVMAIRKPRSEDDARVRIMEACRRPEFAARVEYNKPISGSKGIKGPSIRFAETALRLWGNIESDIQVIYDDDKIRRVKVRLTDLETNASYTKELSIKKTVERKSTKGRDVSEIFGERLNSYGEKVYIVAATDDEMLTKESALISKAIRTEGLRLIPSDIIDDAMSTARETVSKSDSQDPAAAKKRMLDSFAAIGIRPKEVEKYLKHPVDTISPAELQDLRGIYQAIKEGDATWADYVQAEEPAEAAKPVTFNDEPPAAEKPRNPRSDKGQPRKPAGSEDVSTPGQQQQAPAVNETTGNEPSFPPGQPVAAEWDEAAELAAVKADLASYEKEERFRYVILEAKRRAGVDHPVTLDGYNRILEKIREVISEKQK